VWYLRTLVGSALIVVAFTEKLVNPALAMEFLDRYPVLNVARTIGLPVSDLTFIRFAGAVEILFGLLIISGALPQLAVIVAGVPFNATLFFFGATELIGHLPVYGVMLALLVYGSNPELARVVSALRPGHLGPGRNADDRQPVSAGGGGSGTEPPRSDESWTNSSREISPRA
jgi:hypothetical protein